MKEQYSSFEEAIEVKIKKALNSDKAITHVVEINKPSKCDRCDRSLDKKIHVWSIDNEKINIGSCCHCRIETLFESKKREANQKEVAPLKIAS